MSWRNIYNILQIPHLYPYICILRTYVLCIGILEIRVATQVPTSGTKLHKLQKLPLDDTLNMHRLSSSRVSSPVAPRLEVFFQPLLVLRFFLPRLEVFSPAAPRPWVVSLALQRSSFFLEKRQSRIRPVFDSKSLMKINNAIE